VGSSLGAVLTMTVRIQETPPDHKGGYELATNTIESSAASYEDAFADVEARVPEGWRIAAVVVDRG
jgi:hypothetical protein